MSPATSASGTVSGVVHQVGADIEARHAAFLPRCLPPWAESTTGPSHRELDASMVMFDISGFTRLTERLSSQGRAGAEELSEVLHDVFTPLVHAAEVEGADLLKWGGDAVLLLVDGQHHAARAVRAALSMQRVMARVGHLRTSVGRVVLRASSGVESGPVHLVLAGDPEVHRELVVVGPVASAVCRLDSAADAGEVVLGPGAAKSLPSRLVGEAKGPGRLATGMPAAAEAPAPAYAGHRPELIGSLLPPQLRAHLDQQGHEPEHRMASAAFLRFEETDGLLAEHGPGALTDAVDELLRNVQDAVTRYGVAFHESDVDVDGGKIMLLAGAPMSTGDDVEHLVSTVRLVLDRVGRLPVRAGVTHGRVFCGDLGPATRRTYSVKGAAVNLAARLAARAGGGEMLAPAELLTHCHREYDVTPRPPLALKGVSRPVEAVAVGAARTTTRRQQAVETLLLGRERELDLMLSALGAAGGGEGSAVEVVGEPGIGKSRLVVELLSAAAADFAVLSAAGDRSGAATPYGAVRQLLGQALGLAGVPDREEAARLVRSRIAQAAPELLEHAALLDAVLDLGQSTAGDPVTSLDEQFRAEAVQRLVVDVLIAVAPGPTVVVVEDTHLVDPASAPILERLAGAAGSLPWLVLTTRRDVQSGWRSPGEPVVLAPLSEKAARALAEAMTPEDPLPPATVARIAERSGGHPLFLRELALGAARGEDLEDPPESVEALVSVQLDALPPEDRALLRRAAVLGATFAADLLTGMLHGDRQGQDLAEALTRLDRFLALDDHGQVTFRHAVHREVAYAGLSFRTRTSLHAAAAEILERNATIVAERPELLALHWFAGGRYERAWRHARRAGLRAGELFSPAAAADAFHRAAEAARRSADVGPEERARDLESLGDALFLCGRPDESARAYLEAARAAPHPPVAAATLALNRAKVAQRQGRYRLALRRLTEGLRHLEPAPAGADASVARARLLARRAAVLMSQGRYAGARGAAQEAIDAAAGAGELRVLAEAHLVLHGVHMFAGTADGQPHGELALELFLEVGDLGGQAHALNNLAMLRLLEGRWTDAAEMFERAAETFRRVGDAPNAANAAYNQCDLLNRQGRYGEAADLLEGVLRVARAVGDEELVGLVLREQGRALARDGRPQGMDLLVAARAVLQDLQEPHEVVDTDIAVAEAHLMAGRPGEALDTVGRAVVTAHELGAATLLPSAHRVQAAALLELGDLESAATALGEGIRMSQAPELAHERGFLQVVQARLLDLGVDRAGPPGAPTVSVPLQRQALDALESLGVLRAPLPWPIVPSPRSVGNGHG